MMRILENKYRNVHDRLNNDLNLIIQAFINYYGIENSKYIINITI